MVLAGLRIVPLYERFVLWIVPALYVGLALAIDRAARVIHEAPRSRRWPLAIFAMLVLSASGIVCADIFTRGWNDIARGRPAQSKHSLDDRAAVKWLSARLRPGDAVITTRLAWPAIWWYGDISISNADAGGVVHHPGGIPLLEVTHSDSPSTCDGDALREGLKGSRRALVYLGFRDIPEGFDYLLLHALDRIGSVEAFREYDVLGRVAVFDLQHPAASELTLDLMSQPTFENRTLRGCAHVRPVRRW